MNAILFWQYIVYNLKKVPVIETMINMADTTPMHIDVTGT